ncbi:hypothetical protein E6C76_07130 [Pseudothauera nasutitermitis]|uniref:Pyridoxamine 5'-phosphate oxidase putative domain-containing protein n=1 Tax=Pseudothauera nasutitermitis TaxID=2565930 RepID=A0A4S4B1Y9_9RHOO|nr:hypothetical protein [Pseudothauera nasutitermitis]THF66592.1 hypothetical protein E6C76_07130 [Pseudothauera nasutitermitis]
MTSAVTSGVAALINDRDTTKVLVTTDASGVPHAAVTDFVQCGEDGRILYFEPLESSVANRNLTASIWFDRQVSIALRTPADERFHIGARPLRALVAGPAFQRHYDAFRARFGDLDLATVWVLQPERVDDQDFEQARRRQAEDRPFFQHLDRIARHASP